MEKYYGNYLGLVVNNQDPEGRDRVQIYVPGITNTIYDNWNNNNTNKSIGMDIGSTFTLNEEILKKLRSVLPWAEKATPLIGPGTAMYHQENRGAASTPIEPPKNVSSTPKNQRPPVNGHPTTDLTDRTYGALQEILKRFPNVKIVSTKRTPDIENDASRGLNGQIIPGSSASSRHNYGDAFDISLTTSDGKSLDVKQRYEISKLALSLGMNEIIQHGPIQHLHIGYDDKKTKAYINGPEYMQTLKKEYDDKKIPEYEPYSWIDSAEVGIPPTSATPESSLQDKDVKGSTGTTTTVSKGTATSVPDVPQSVSPGEGVPSGTRSTTKILSRVWLFFYGGDIQKPVFFAYSLPPNETRAHNNFNVDAANGSNRTNVSDERAENPNLSGNLPPVEEQLPIGKEGTFGNMKFEEIEYDGTVNDGTYVGTLVGANQINDQYKLTIDKDGNITSATLIGSN